MSGQGSISIAEREKYRDIFLHLNTRDGLLSAVEAQAVLLKSGLSHQQLEQIWNLSDLGHDGHLNCEEFIIAMHLTYNFFLNDLPIPATLPQYLLPAGYENYVTSSEAPLGTQAFAYGLPLVSDYTTHRNATDSTKSIEFTDNFDWYLAPSQKLKYENIFHEAPLKNGLISKEHALEIFLSNSRPREEFSILWNLIDVFQKDAINFQQFVLFHHIIHARKSGKPFPTSLPPEIILNFKSTSSLGPKIPDHVSPITPTRRHSTANPAEHREIVELETELANLELQLSKLPANPMKRENVMMEFQSMIKFMDSLLETLPKEGLQETIETTQKEIKQAEMFLLREKSTMI